MFSNERGVCVHLSRSFTLCDPDICASYIRVTEVGINNQVIHRVTQLSECASTLCYFTLELSFLTQSAQRNSIAIPQEAWASFAEIIQGYSQKMS
jgi:hypothetical protein